MRRLHRIPLSPGRALAAGLAVLLTACAAPPGADEGVPWNSETNGLPPVQRHSEPSPPQTDERLPARVPPDRAPPPDEAVAPYRPILPGLPSPQTLPVQAAPAPSPNFAPGLPPGPVTNYGTGGMQAPPGAPPNPPYPPGGLMQ